MPVKPDTPHVSQAASKGGQSYNEVYFLKKKEKSDKKHEFHPELRPEGAIFDEIHAFCHFF